MMMCGRECGVNGIKCDRERGELMALKCFGGIAMAIGHSSASKNGRRKKERCS